MPQSQTADCFTLFDQDIDGIAEPEKFTYPFCYQPHLLATIASKQLQAQLQTLNKAQTTQGRMYGVLVVKNNQNKLGFLSAVSGSNQHIISEQLNKIALVPAIFSGLSADNGFAQQQNEINQLNTQIDAAQKNAEFVALTTQIALNEQTASDEIQQLQTQHSLQKRARKKTRKTLELALKNQQISPENYKQESIQLARESVNNKKQLQALKLKWQQTIDSLKQRQSLYQQQLAELSKSRRKKSSALQKLFFKQYQLLNIQGETKDIVTLFHGAVNPKPPAGTGDCAAPKLLQYAFKHQLTPVCMAEFWWGNSPKSEIRQQGIFYPACQGKCQPLLTHMLSGMLVDENPLLINPAKDIPMEVVFQDEDIIVVNKPAGLLSVPGKTINDSVYSRVQKLCPNASGSLIVHRLDMATSGLLVLALNERAHKHLQKQFINKVIDKRYVALLSGEVSESSGIITLPLRGDINDRPRQLVCHQHGKPAETRWQRLETTDGKSKLSLYPVTGRTHQLRVHCAHPEGLDTPILGDGLYGVKDKRLHLHAEYLSLRHPRTQEILSFHVESSF